MSHPLQDRTEFTELERDFAGVQLSESLFLLEAKVAQAQKKAETAPTQLERSLIESIRFQAGVYANDEDEEREEQKRLRSAQMIYSTMERIGDFSAGLISSQPLADIVLELVPIDPELPTHPVLPSIYTAA